MFSQPWRSRQGDSHFLKSQVKLLNIWFTANDTRNSISEEELEEEAEWTTEAISWQWQQAKLDSDPFHAEEGTFSSSDSWHKGH